MVGEKFMRKKSILKGIPQGLAVVSIFASKPFLWFKYVYISSRNCDNSLDALWGGCIEVF